MVKQREGIFPSAFGLHFTGPPPLPLHQQPPPDHHGCPLLATRLGPLSSQALSPSPLN